MKLIDNRKSTGIFVIIFGIALVGFIVYFIFFYNFSKSENDSNSVKTQQPVERQNLPKNINTPTNNQKTNNSSNNNKISDKVLVQEDVRQLSSSFVERLGSWSNQSSSSNLSDLKFFMTSSMQDWANDSIVKNRFQLENYETYYGITTKSVTSEVLEYKDTNAKVMVSTKRTETKDNTTRVFNQDILIKLKRVGKSWKVDGAYWQ